MKTVQFEQLALKVPFRLVLALGIQYSTCLKQTRLFQQVSYHPLVLTKSMEALRVNRFTTCILLLFIGTIFTGCTTSRTSDTDRTGLEQLLISNAVDQTLDKTGLPPVEGRKVFVEEKYLDSVDKGYVVGRMRQKLLEMGALLVDKKEDSEVTVELCSGGVGTDSVSSFIGSPGLTVPGLPVELPEVRLYEKNSQFGTAKIGVVAYATDNGRLLYNGGTPLARASDSKWSLMGIGPFEEGTVRREVVSQTGEVDFSARMADKVSFGKKTR